MASKNKHVVTHRHAHISLCSGAQSITAAIHTPTKKPKSQPRIIRAPGDIPLNASRDAPSTNQKNIPQRSSSRQDAAASRSDTGRPTKVSRSNARRGTCAGGEGRARGLERADVQRLPVSTHVHTYLAAVALPLGYSLTVPKFEAPRNLTDSATRVVARWVSHNTMRRFFSLNTQLRLNICRGRELTTHGRFAFATTPL